MVAIDPKLRKALAGISGILVTPFDDQDAVAPKRLQPIVDRAVQAGVHILVANGNTGELYGLTTAEAETMVHSIPEEIAGRMPLLAGVGRSIKDARARARLEGGRRGCPDGASAELVTMASYQCSSDPARVPQPDRRRPMCRIIGTAEAFRR
jgi:hypothetical protein